MRATVRRGRERERVRVLVHCHVAWIAFAAESAPGSLDTGFLPMPRDASPPPEPFVVVPLSLLEREIEPAMLVRLGPGEPTSVWHGNRVGDLVFNYQD